MSKTPPSKIRVVAFTCNGAHSCISITSKVIHQESHRIWWDPWNSINCQAQWRCFPMVTLYTCARWMSPQWHNLVNGICIWAICSYATQRVTWLWWTSQGSHKSNTSMTNISEWFHLNSSTQNPSICHPSPVIKAPDSFLFRGLLKKQAKGGFNPWHGKKYEYHIIEKIHELMRDFLLLNWWGFFFLRASNYAPIARL